MNDNKSELAQDLDKDAKAREEKRRQHKKNSVLTVVSNFMLALSIGSVGSGIAQVFLSIRSESLTQISGFWDFVTICFGLVFLGISVILAKTKEPEK